MVPVVELSGEAADVDERTLRGKGRLGRRSRTTDAFQDRLAGRERGGRFGHRYEEAAGGRGQKAPRQT